MGWIIGVVLAVVVFIYIVLFHLSVSVPDYMAARHYRFGKPTTEGPISGKRILVIPGIDQLVMIDKRIQKSTVENISVLTKERQMMSLSVTLIWKPINAAMTIENIRPEDIEPTFFKIAESVIKNESSKMTVDEILEKRNILAKNLMVTLSDITESWGTAISSVNISNLVVVNDSFMRNMAMPKEIELERQTRIAELEKELAIQLKSIEKDKDEELFKLEAERLVGMKKEEIATSLESAKKDREIHISELQAKLEKVVSEIALIQQNCSTTAEAEKLKALLIAETDGLKEKLKVINSFSSNALSYEILKILPELYKNINIGDVTLFDANGGQNNPFDFIGCLASSALSVIKKVDIGAGTNTINVESCQPVEES